jgi:hypothetical protein
MFSSMMKSPSLFCTALAVFLASSCICRAQSPTTADAPTFQLPDNFFPILSWDLPEWSDAAFSSADHGLEGLAHCGFTTAAFVRPHHLARVEKLGLQCIVAPEHFPTPWRTMSDEQIEKAVKELVDSAAGNASVTGYFLADEPGAPDFPALEKAVAAVKKFAPGKLAYINLFPDYATPGAKDLSQLGTATYTDYLEQFVSQVKPQLLSYDNYQIEYSRDQKNPAIAASYYNNLLTVRRVAMEHHLPFWNIVSSNQLIPAASVPSPANLALQAYTTLAAGGKGLTWYTYISPGYAYCPIDKAGHFTATWSYLKMVNDQVKVLGPILRPLTSTGVYFTAPQPAPSLPQLRGQWVAKVACDQPFMIGEFGGPHAEKYAVIVNLSLRESAQFKLTPRDPHADVRQISAVDASELPLDSGNAGWLPAGQGLVLHIQTSR